MPAKGLEILVPTNGGRVQGILGTFHVASLMNYGSRRNGSEEASQGGVQRAQSSLEVDLAPIRRAVGMLASFWPGLYHPGRGTSRGCCG